MGIYARGNKLWAVYRDSRGKRAYRASPFRVGQEDAARAWLGSVEAGLTVAKHSPKHRAKRQRATTGPYNNIRHKTLCARLASEGWTTTGGFIRMVLDAVHGDCACAYKCEPCGEMAAGHGIHGRPAGAPRTDEDGFCVECDACSRCHDRVFLRKNRGMKNPDGWIIDEDNGVVHVAEVNINSHATPEKYAGITYILDAYGWVLDMTVVTLSGAAYVVPWHVMDRASLRETTEATEADRPPAPFPIGDASFVQVSP